MKKEKNKNKVALFDRFGFTPIYLLVLLLVSAIALVVIISRIDSNNNQISFNINTKIKDNTFKKFKSVDEFKAYIEDMDQTAYYGGMGMVRNFAQSETMMLDEAQDIAMPAPELVVDGNGLAPDRVSDTNVQVLGIDEPDIVKTDGKQIYFSDNIGNYWISNPMPAVRMMEDSFIDIDPSVEFQNQVKTNIINAWPASDLALSSKIDLAGDLLLVKNILVVFSGQDIVAYDVSNPKEPSKKWSIKLDEQTYLITSRLYGDKIYLVTQTSLNRSNPCPISPLALQDKKMIVPCMDIYYPNNSSSVDSTFTAISLNPESGEFEDQISFVGSQSTANIYMSTDSLYIAYTQNLNMFDYMFKFVNTELNDLAPANVLAKLNKLNSYDISSQSKLNELQTTLDEWLQTLGQDEMLKMQTEMQNRAAKYYEENKRAVLSTGIAKIDIANLDIKASGSVPGYLLNQFALDEYNGYLRVATTIGESWGWGISAGGTQVNDVYTLDSNLKISGSILDLGLGERIYAARFMGDVGYLVTFKQTDPFYVLDLSNPKEPKMLGELKIPGYSSYLHPIADGRILGVGMEEGKVKLSYFDVSNPSNPQEIAKYSLDDYGSDVLYNHHAFLQDPKHQVFFLPSYNGGYVFSYANEQLELVKTVAATDAKRALYIGDYLYIIANDYVAVLDENNWEKVKDLAL
ncbi:MAG: beta-propeller domain-containing protein [Patescibacteria group bacterium]